jgi:hypothetical protein
MFRQTISGFGIPKAARVRMAWMGRKISHLNSHSGGEMRSPWPKFGIPGQALLTQFEGQFPLWHFERGCEGFPQSAGRAKGQSGSRQLAGQSLSVR